VTDDDLDFDLDLEPDPLVTPRAKTAPPEEPKDAWRDEPGVVPRDEPNAGGSARVMAERKPGVLSRVGSSVSDQFSFITHPNWSIRNFLLILAALIVLVVLAENWAAVRISFLGLRAELPKAVAFLLNIILGGLLTWFWLRRGSVAREE